MGVPTDGDTLVETPPPRTSLLNGFADPLVVSPTVGGCIRRQALAGCPELRPVGLCLNQNESRAALDGATSGDVPIRGVRAGRMSKPPFPQYWPGVASGDAGRAECLEPCLRRCFVSARHERSILANPNWSRMQQLHQVRKKRWLSSPVQHVLPTTPKHLQPSAVSVTFVLRRVHFDPRAGS